MGLRRNVQQTLLAVWLKEFFSTLPVKQLGKEKRLKVKVSQAEHWFSGCTRWRWFYLLCSPQMHINLQLSLKHSETPQSTQTSAVTINWSTFMSSCLCQSAQPLLYLSSSICWCLPPSPAKHKSWSLRIRHRGVQREEEMGDELWQLFKRKPPRGGATINRRSLKEYLFDRKQINLTLIKRQLSLLQHVFLDRLFWRQSHQSGQSRW